MSVHVFASAGDNRAFLRNSTDWDSTAAAVQTPRWDAGRRRLWWGRTVVKVLDRESPGQMPVLAAFEEAGWPRRIDVTALLRAGGLRPRSVVYLVKNLNRGLRWLRFHADGTKHGVTWEPPRRRANDPNLPHAKV